ncbi:MAG: hypothetical protein OEZ36_09915, partial [Spirochaetota bacterium]|nr:hypothetical protein [Spirochaetota bacterium]
QFLIFLLDDVSRKPEEMNKVFTAFQIKDNNRWKVLSADTDTVSRLADKLDLRYTVLDRKTFSYFHSNAIAIVGYDGSIVQVYYGLNFRTDDMLKTISRQVNEAARTTISP